MATVTKGRTFVSGETVTPTKLNELVDLATVTSIQTADISDAAVTTAKIANSAVNTAKIASSTIVGTVSQSGGLPTGAIMESGSNANGSFIRYADGTMICTGTATGNTGGKVAITLPSTFSSSGYALSFAASATAARIPTSEAQSTTAFEFNIFDTAGSRTASVARYIAIGRWF